jgi:hypothetical protein
MHEEFSGGGIMAYTAIDDPEAYFQVKAYTGDGTTVSGGGLSVVLDGDTDMQPDMVWSKNRDDATGHRLVDSVRGVTKQIHPNNTNGEATDTEGLTAFNSDGFTVGNDDGWNTDGEKIVAWCWKETATAGFDMVSYTGSGSSQNVSHSLSAVPHLMIVKRYDGDGNYWVIYHHKNTSAPETDYLRLDTTVATADAADRWDDTAPTSSVFTVKDSSQVNGSSNTYMNYLWSEKQGFSKFGSHIGNGNADGTFVYTGFRPAFIMTKNTARSDNWMIFDNKRLGYNVDNNFVFPNLANTEVDSDQIDILSNGFKCRTTNDAVNSSGEVTVYMAFAEAPFVNSKGVPCNAR